MFIVLIKKENILFHLLFVPQYRQKSLMKNISLPHRIRNIDVQAKEKNVAHTHRKPEEQIFCVMACERTNEHGCGRVEFQQ